MSSDTGVRDEQTGIGTWERDCIILWSGDSRRCHDGRRRERENRSRREEPLSTARTASVEGLKERKDVEGLVDEIQTRYPSTLLTLQCPLPRHHLHPLRYRLHHRLQQCVRRHFIPAHRARADRRYSLSFVSTSLTPFLLRYLTASTLLTDATPITSSQPSLVSAIYLPPIPANPLAHSFRAHSHRSALEAPQERPPLGVWAGVERCAGPTQNRRDSMHRLEMTDGDGLGWVCEFPAQGVDYLSVGPC